MQRLSPHYQSFSVFNQLKLEYAKLNQRRKIFYEADSLELLFETNELNYREVDDVAECMYQLHDTDPKLIFDFVVKNPCFRLLPSSETCKIASNMIALLHCLEGAYFTWRFANEKAKCYMVMPNKMYLNMARIEKYFNRRNGEANKLEEQKSNLIRFFAHKFECIKNFINTQIVDLNPAYDEIVFLIGLITFDTNIEGITESTAKTLEEMQKLLVRDFKAMYNTTNIDPQMRLETMFSVVSGIKNSSRINR
uniref:NR LBD domain-containing protein n=1 Tax=Panagrellus redivivus TaxID=6233 RepID=A0A7E4VSY4_PANRE